MFFISASSGLNIPCFLPLDHRIFVCSLRLLPFPLDYNFLISSRLSNFMFSTSTRMFRTSRFICFQLRYLYIRLRIQNFRLRIRNIRLRIRNIRLRIRNIRLRIRNSRLRIRNIRLRLKYYCSYFCPQWNAIHFLVYNFSLARHFCKPALDSDRRTRSSA